MAEYLNDKDDVNFWKTWRKRYCSRSVKMTNVLNGKSGEDNIRTEFTQYYKNIFVPNTENADCEYRNKVDEAVKESNNFRERTPYVVNVQDMLFCVNKLKLKKAAGDDGIMSEHIVYGGQRFGTFMSFVQHHNCTQFCTG